MQGRLFTNGELIKLRMLAVVEEMCTEKLDLILLAFWGEQMLE